MACLMGAPAAFAGDTPVQNPLPPAVDLSAITSNDAGDDVLADTTLNLNLPVGAVKVRPAAKTGRKKAPLAGAPSRLSSADTVMLGEGPVALDLKVPGGKDLSSGATLNLNLPDGAVKVQGSASVGKEDGQTTFWHKDAAEVEAKLSGPLGSSLTASGENRLSLTYRAPESVGASDQAAHLVRTQTQAGHAALTVPVAPFRVTVGANSSSDQTQQGAPGDSVSFTQTAVRTSDHAAYVDVEWRPLAELSLKGGTAARVADISWQNAHSSTYRSVNPNLTATVKPFPDTTVTTKLEEEVAPFDAAAFAAYANADSADASGFAPDHAWQVQTKVEQKFGSASLSATYTTAHNGTVTEFAEVRGVQAPATATLLGRKSIALALHLPLSTIGLPHTDFSSEATWQNSQVVDPVTYETRAASGEAAEKVSLKLAHKLPTSNLSLGFTGDFTGARTSYQVSELSTTEPSASLGAFVTYKPGPYEVDFNVSGLYGATTRDDFFTGPRGSSLYSHSALQDNSGPALRLSLKRPF
jgi:hypothetical protein